MVYTTHTENFLKALYNRMNIFSPQQLNFSTIASQIGIRVFYWSDKSQALFYKNNSYIFLNDFLSTQQQWQDFCHELAHVLLHTGHQGRMSPLFREYQENKANNFMYHACVPSFMLDEIEPINLTVEYVQQQFNVEYDFAFKRLEQYFSKKNSF
ncbi:ImmA/IrrE family metallo-endopeptidase [Lysinibacillus pakistanensis]|uniref:ImmA/IrrE family metallo-endopeptidase n=1 Tax=Lysinibacillus pakistanensis TaxID=759811 RepID=A0AAX3X521_9BACI|nr:ImmA/IrrE family metallo-endopeptidase [Lysinibacillus pakistanensis]MDM5233341.1 ImmA/IrrE family metallo-endopeptidase [Lysinibacillus pakistanensis]WHY48815.1 ImmA/IrrE family metallo-endopeptidase [Lysinibacillus pakistanensis]WHY53827.1 ImmA/IrrE family metallo-endopeptidase [Lysinibacillus pakistanensis]